MKLEQIQQHNRQVLLFTLEQIKAARRINCRRLVTRLTAAGYLTTRGREFTPKALYRLCQRTGLRFVDWRQWTETLCKEGVLSDTLEAEPQSRVLLDP